ncbi:hypothetical protein DM02DRAFT_660349 [Periconia macrospinosa]|uniref:Uncharacterized protein n=1 Tax=Periconia macrospinosa TaxID=97972 RepID=A0A2V1DAZ6_9PLEO|nr:hypothetical protein DM02DRAFT_660349 [Periconia macrospinosa]
MGLSCPPLILNVAYLGLLLLSTFVLNLLRGFVTYTTSHESNPTTKDPPPVVESVNHAEPTVQPIAPPTSHAIVELIAQAPTPPNSPSLKLNSGHSNPLAMAVSAILLCPFCKTNLTSESDEDLRIHVRRCIVNTNTTTCPSPGCSKHLASLSNRNRVMFTKHLRSCTLSPKATLFNPKPKSPKKFHLFISTNPFVPSITLSPPPDPPRTAHIIRREARRYPDSFFNTEMLYPPPTTSKNRLDVYFRESAHYPWLAKSVVAKEHRANQLRWKRREERKKNESVQDRELRQRYMRLRIDKRAEKLERAFKQEEEDETEREKEKQRMEEALLKRKQDEETEEADKDKEPKRAKQIEEGELLQLGVIAF